MTRNSDRRRRAWFALGAQALSRISGTTVTSYACPLCMNLFPPEALDTPGVLTIEHVPPAKVDGRELVLTCGSCNREAGRSFDRAAADEYQLLRFMRGEDMGGADGLRVRIDGVRGRLRQTEGNSELWSVPGANPPGAETNFTKPRDPRSEFEVEISGKLDRHLVKLSYLRAALLVTFARWGYRAVASPAFDSLRDQIERPAIVDLPHRVSINATFPTSTRELVLIDSPDWLRSTMVRIGQRSMFLPRIDDDSSDFFERIAAGVRDGGTFKPMGYPEGWPKSPMHLLDLAGPEDVGRPPVAPR